MANIIASHAIARGSIPRVGIFDTHGCIAQNDVNAAARERMLLVSFAHPTMASTMTESHLTSLPSELLEHVALSCAACGHPQSVGALAQTCRYLRDLFIYTADHHLWRSIFLTMFDDPRQCVLAKSFHGTCTICIARVQSTYLCVMRTSLAMGVQGAHQCC